MMHLEQGVRPGERTPQPREGRPSSIPHTPRKCQRYFGKRVVFGPRRPFFPVGRKSGCRAKGLPRLAPARFGRRRGGRARGRAAPIEPGCFLPQEVSVHGLKVTSVQSRSSPALAGVKASPENGRRRGPVLTG